MIASPDRAGGFAHDAFVAALDEVRRSRGARWQDVARQSGISHTTLCRLRSGRNTDIENFAALCAWAGLSPGMFMFRRRAEEYDGADNAGGGSGA